MSTITRTKKTVQVSRFVKVLTPPDASGQGAEILITQTRGKKTEVTRYWIDRIEADFGKGFLVEKEGNGIDQNEEYHLNIDGDTCQCECLGFLRWNHCKHTAAIKRLLDLGKL